MNDYKQQARSSNPLAPTLPQARSSPTKNTPRLVLLHAASPICGQAPDAIFELRIGDKNIARVFFFFRQGQEIILTNGYVKKQQKVDTGELERARRYKKDWEERHI